MTGYTHPDVNFAVEQYKGEWIMRAILPADQPAAGDAMAAITAWKARNMVRFEALSDA